jgi:NADPH:quinone reductase-like Zn-dependent oxidoreductase
MAAWLLSSAWNLLPNVFTRPSVVTPPVKPYTTPKIDFASKVDLSLLKGKTVLITGGASGMGAAMAIALAKAGYETFGTKNL